MFDDLIYRLRALLRPARVERDLRDELALHLEREAAKYQASGLSAAEAHRRARVALGGIERVKEECRDARGTRRLGELWQDLRYGIRQLRISPGFTSVAILSLTLGIGANTAIFQLLNAVRLRTLPVARPHELVEIHIAGGNGGMGVTNARYAALTRPLWEEIRRDHPAFSGVFAWSANVVRIGSGELQRASGLTVSGEFFDVLGVPALVGRTLTPADESAACPATVAVVSHAYWQRVLGGRDLTSGITLVVNGQPKQVVGVTPPWFFGLAVGESFDVAQPYCRPRELQRNVFEVAVMGRMRPGWTVDRASAQLQAASPAWFAATTITGYDPGTVETYRRFRLHAISAARGVSWLRRTYDGSLGLLLGITGLVLLIACANLANLFLARASAREREMAVRVALGASRGRLFRQLLAESAMLAALGVGFGLWLAQFLSQLLVRTISVAGSVPIALPAAIDWRVLLFATAVGTATCLLFGTAPALRAARSQPVDAIKAQGRGMSATRERVAVQRLLVVMQIAVSVVLLVGALLFVRSFRNMSTFDPGLRVSGVTMVFVRFPGMSGPAELHETVQRQLLDDIRAVPGIVDAATTTHLPLLGGSWGHEVRVGTANGSSRFTWVSHTYFRTMGIPILEGRGFDTADSSSSRRVAVVNHAFVRAFTGPNPVGRILRTGQEPGYPATDYHIVGVVPDTQYDSLRGSPPPMAFAPAWQAPQLGPGAIIMVHSSLPADKAMGAVKAAVLGRHATALVEHEVFEERVQSRMLPERLMAMLAGFFGALAAALATIGLYGLMSYLVARRRNEIGVRLALGARPGLIVRMVVDDAGRLLAVGLAAGLVLAVAAGRIAGSASLLFNLTPHDPATLVAACALLTVIAAAASVIPARRAARLDALVALRHE